MWNLRVADQEPEAIDQQVKQLLSEVTPDLTPWQELSARFQVDLFCGFFMDSTNQGFALSKETMSSLSARGIEIGFDIYAPLADEGNDGHG